MHHVQIFAEARSLINEKMEVQVAKMKEAFETTAKEMGGQADVEVKVMYPGFKFADGDHVVEVAKRAAEKLVVHLLFTKVVAEVMQT